MKNKLYIEKDLETLDKSSVLYKILKESVDHKNELILEGWTICMMLEGIIEDDWDYYFRILRPYEGIVYHTAVGGYDFLKGNLDDEIYNGAIELFKLNYELWFYRILNLDENRSAKIRDKIIDDSEEIKKILKDRKNENKK